MNRIIRIIALLALIIINSLNNVFADGFSTPNDGSTYSFATLATIDASGVSIIEKDGQECYLMTISDTISANDVFLMDPQAVVLMADGVQLVILGKADFNVENVVFEPKATDAQPYGIFVGNEQEKTFFRNCTFNQVGLRNMSSTGLILDSVKFNHHNGMIGQAALVLGANGASFEITNCTFAHCAKSAIAGAANYQNPIVIDHCEFLYNGQDNRNMPQLNLTTADSVVIRNCTLLGDSTKTKVGGITVSNLVGFTNDMNTLIENNTIKDHRYGIATYCHQSAFIRNNTLIGNCHEENPMNGGSGINVYDPYGTQYTYIEGNHIERSLWGITLVGGGEANLGRTDVDTSSANYNPGRNIFIDNGNSGQLYDLYNNSKNTVYAQGNTWNVAEQTEELIEEVISHKHDDPSLGEVIFMPATEPTGIKNLRKTTESEVIYDLQGRPYSSAETNSLRPGIYIKNNQKIIIR
ncbi:MAG: hypothetical protein K6C10_00560 [Prevotella sp.]|nr:hypothetical protein [Prevotella sp.]